MKLILDANLSPRLISELSPLFPGSTHVFDHGDIASDDLAIWRLAAADGYVIVSKDTDFLDLALVHGAPPKVILLRTGNASTTHIANALKRAAPAIAAFVEDREQSVLIVGGSSKVSS